MTVPNAGPAATTIDRSATKFAVLFLVGLAWALWIDVPKFNEGGDNYTVVGDLATGLLMQWVGLLVWRRPGTGYVGPFVYIAGYLWFVGSGLPEPFSFLTGPWRGYYHLLLVAVVLAYPAGVLSRSTDLALLAVLAVAYVVRSLARQFLFDPAVFFHRPGATNPTLIVWNEGAWSAAELAAGGIAGLVGFILAVSCIVRWRRASGPARRTLTPVLIAGLLVAPLLGWTTLTTPTNVFDLPLPFDPTIIFWLQLIAWGLIPVAIAIGVMRQQNARASVADLLIGIDRGIPVGQLEGVMRERLRDPSLRLLFPRDEGGVVDGTGAAATLASPSPGRSVTPIDDTHGRPMAYIVHDPALAEDPGLVRAVGTAARLSLENERLQAEVRAQLKDVRELSSRLVAASDAERRRVERDLHDGAQQRLVTLALRLQLARDAQGSAGDELARMLADASAELDAALGELRELARGIHPQILTRYGLADAVMSLAQRATIPVDVKVAEGRCTPDIDSTAYFVVAECLTNIARYASASQARVIATREGGRLHLRVEDDGAGGADPNRGSGLTGLRDRVVAVGGSFRVESCVGAGTTVAVDLPCG